MYPLIVCTCGRAIGDLYEAYAAMRDELYRAAYEKEGGIGYDPSMIPLIGDITSGVGLTDILDMLGLTKECMCCRDYMLTQVIFVDIY